MTDQPAPVDARTALFELSDKARQFGINPDRPFFPVNSMRLLYFLILEKMTGSKEAVDCMNDFIPKIEAVLSARNASKVGFFSPSLKEDLSASQKPLDDLFAFFQSSSLEQLFHQLFGVLLPSQDLQLTLFIQQLSHLQVKNEQILYQLLDIRSADSIIFSTILSEIIRKYHQNSPNSIEQRELETYLHWQLHLIYQWNDLIDSVVFAKEDIASSTFSPIYIVQEITQDPTAAKTILAQTLERLTDYSTSFSLPELDPIIRSYQVVLKSVLIPNS